MAKAKKQKTSKLKKSVVGFSQSHMDFMIALLIVSLLVNLFVLVGWITLQVTGMYDQQVADFLFADRYAK